MYRILAEIIGHPVDEITELNDRSEADIEFYLSNGFIEAIFDAQPIEAITEEF